MAPLFRNKTALCLTLTFLTCSCGGAGNPSAGDPITRASAVPSAAESPEVQAYIPDQFGQPLGDFVKTYSNSDRLSYLDYEFIKSTRIARNDSGKGNTRIEYVILRRNGRFIAQFDTSLDQLTEARFGLVSLLGQNDRRNGQKQDQCDRANELHRPSSPV